MSWKSRNAPLNWKAQTRSLRREIQEREQIQKALELERDKFMNILDSMEDRVYIANLDCDILYTNPATEREFGPVNGRKCYEYLHDLKDVCPGCKQQDVYLREVRPDG